MSLFRVTKNPPKKQNTSELHMHSLIYSYINKTGILNQFNRTQDAKHSFSQSIQQALNRI